jgi:serine/threonine protein kinase
MAQLACSGCGKRYQSNKMPTPGKVHRCQVCQGVLIVLTPEEEAQKPPSSSTLPLPVTPLPPPLKSASPSALAASLPQPSSKSLVAEPGLPHRVFGPFEILRVLGRGGMGVVYEAIDQRNGRTVALKTLHSRPNELRKDEERFIREGRVCTALPAHPCLVGVYETGVIDGRRYLAMERIVGESLMEWRLIPSVTQRDQILLIRDVARAVHVAHEHGVVHRDLKPQNILVDAERRPHVTDFGLAKWLGRDAAALTIEGMVVGSPTYMSPEQAQGLKTVDRRADVYALGIMLFEALAGQAPFLGDRPLEVLRKVSREDPPRPSDLLQAKGLPPPDPALEAICLKALAKSPADRPQTALELAESLTAWLDGKAPAPGPEPAPIPPQAVGSSVETAASDAPSARRPGWFRRLFDALFRVERK